MYLACRSRSDIAFVVGKLSKHNAEPQKNHLKVTRQVVCYPKKIIHLELIYGQRSDRSSQISLVPYGLIRYEDNNFAGDSIDQKSVMRYYFFLNSVVVLWSSKKQRTVSTSIIKVEYLVIDHIVGEGVWIKGFINELLLETTRLGLKGNNKANFNLTKSPESQH